MMVAVVIVMGEVGGEVLRGGGDKPTRSGSGWQVRSWPLRQSCIQCIPT